MYLFLITNYVDDVPAFTLPHQRVTGRLICYSACASFVNRVAMMLLCYVSGCFNVYRPPAIVLTQLPDGFVLVDSSMVLKSSTM